MIDAYQEAGVQVLTAASGSASNEAIRLLEISTGESSRAAAATGVGGPLRASAFDGLLPAAGEPSPASDELLPAAGGGGLSGATSEPSPASGRPSRATGESSGSGGDQSSSSHALYQKLFIYANKKYSSCFTPGDLSAVRRISPTNQTISDRIGSHIVELLKKQRLTSYEEELLKVLLSRVVSLVDERAYSDMVAILGETEIESIEERSFTMANGLGNRLALLDNIIANHKGMDSLLLRLEEEKIKLLQQGMANSSCYKMITVVIMAVEYMKIPIADNASEQTYYRRFAVLLDFVFQGTDIDMQDGEIVSIATRQAMESNDSDGCFGRRIDLLLKPKGCTVELCSNEWKNKASEGLKFKQQVKNIRSNCAILSSLYLKSNSQVKQVIAAEFTGSAGYLYRLELVNSDYYVAYPIDTLCLPRGIHDLAVFRNTIKLLFERRSFLVELSDVMKACLLEDSMQSLVRRPRNNTPPSSPPQVFFSPTKKRGLKRSLEEIDN